MEVVGLLGMLGVCSWEDLRKRRIRVTLVLGFGVLGLMLHLIFQNLTIWEMLGGMLIGAVLFVVSILSKERIGKGDALLIGVTGIYLGFWDNLILLWASSALAGLVGFVMILAGKKKKEIPFVPFVLAVYIILLIVGGGGFVS